tara:strand:- start:185 stop:436 length:252 start_codon:yes stop_codon:yes gene_type:complete
MLFFSIIFITVGVSVGLFIANVIIGPNMFVAVFMFFWLIFIVVLLSWFWGMWDYKVKRKEFITGFIIAIGLLILLYYTYPYTL